MLHQCSICSRETVFVGLQRGKLDARNFVLRHCEHCRYSYIENYRTDFSRIYNEDYYFGRGADSLVDYVYELTHPSQTIRTHEWEGVFKIFKQLRPEGGRWLDFGCGGGGMVRFALEKGIEAIGVEDGWIADRGRAMGIPIIKLSELRNFSGQFDFVSAIEVLEHVPNPLNIILEIKKLMKPGGILFLTTGNAKPWRSKLLAWPYTQCPDVHISFFEPETLSRCLMEAGFEPRNIKFSEGITDIIKFKVLKTLRIRNRGLLLDLLPWSVLGKVIDAKYKVSEQPYGVLLGN